MFDIIPFHIQELIIKRLPIVSLLQFRSVSKTRKSLIDTSNFIAAHSVTESQHLLIRYEDKESDTVGKYLSFPDDDTFPHQRNSIAVPMPNKFNLDPETNLCFGVSPVTTDPKIVEITQFHKTSYHCDANVYTVSSGNWRNLSNNLPGKPFRIFWPQVVVDRFIYWCAFDPMNVDSELRNHNFIMSFDITNESFGVVELPDSLRRHSPKQLCISKVRESLVLLEYDSYHKRACSVWMIENAVEKSFTKRFTVEAPHYWSMSITTLGFRKNGKPIVKVENAHMCYEQGALMVYEPNIECFKYHGMYGKPGTFFVHSYIETLVLIGQSDRNIKVEDDV
ncbi:unnamed protein product [Lactuca saligna]|uniref:F-box domain-containing protein n=1 Tax=Lactuca saligna TaxID=75948 RepID=A0AA35V4V6_LACSI|nr:unnamed protein product [Lactuca saligna]